MFILIFTKNLIYDFGKYARQVLTCTLLTMKDREGTEKVEPTPGRELEMLPEECQKTRKHISLKYKL